MNFTPEYFARTLATDMGIPRHQEVLLGHAIRCKLFEMWEASLLEPVAQSPSRKGVSRVRIFERDEDAALWAPALEQIVAPPIADRRREQAKEERGRRLKARGKRRYRLEEEEEEEEEGDDDIGGDDDDGEGEGEFYEEDDE